MEHQAIITKTAFDHQQHGEDELALMTQIAAGSTDAFQIVLDAHMLAVYRFAYSILKDVSAAEDITQETCLKLLRHAKD